MHVKRKGKEKRKVSKRGVMKRGRNIGKIRKMRRINEDEIEEGIK